MIDMHKTYLILGSIAIVLTLIGIVFSSGITGNFLWFGSSNQKSELLTGITKTIQHNKTFNEAVKTFATLENVCLNGVAYLFKVNQTKIFHNSYSNETNKTHEIELYQIADLPYPTILFRLDDTIFMAKEGNSLYKEGFSLCVKKVLSESQNAVINIIK
jgi:hypothetical protein